MTEVQEDALQKLRRLLRPQQSAGPAPKPIEERVRKEDQPRPIVQRYMDAFGIGAAVIGKLEHIKRYDAPRLRPTFLRELGLEVREAPVRSSNVKLYQECRRRYMFKCRLGLTRPDAYSKALWIGRVMHELLARFYQGAAIANFGHMTNELIDEAFRELSPDDTGLLMDGSSVTERHAALTQDARMACALAYELALRIPLADILRTYEIVSAEELFNLKLPTIKAPLILKADLLLRNRKTGAYWIVDHKTTSESPVARASRLPFEFQPRFYAFILHMLLKAVQNPNNGPAPKVGGFMHTIIRKPTIRQKKNQTFEEYIEEVHEWYKGKQASNPCDPPILLSTVTHDDTVVDEETLVLIHEVALAGTSHLNIARYPTNDQACHNWGKACPYIGLCRSAADHRVPEEWPTLLQGFVQKFREDEENADAADH